MEVNRRSIQVNDRFEEHPERKDKRKIWRRRKRMYVWLLLSLWLPFSAKRSLLASFVDDGRVTGMWTKSLPHNGLLWNHNHPSPSTPFPPPLP